MDSSGKFHKMEEFEKMFPNTKPVIEFVIGEEVEIKGEMFKVMSTTKSTLILQSVRYKATKEELLKQWQEHK